MSEISPESVLAKSTIQASSDIAKIQLKSDNINPFGGLFSTLNIFNRSGKAEKQSRVAIQNFRKSAYDTKNGSPSAGAPKVFFKYFYVKTDYFFLPLDYQGYLFCTDLCTGQTKNPDIMSKVILITGASSGIGYQTAETLAKRGHKVYGAARRVDRMEPMKASGVVPVKMDVTDEASIDAGLKQIIDAEGRIDSN